MIVFYIGIFMYVLDIFLKVWNHQDSFPPQFLSRGWRPLRVEAAPQRELPDGVAKAVQHGKNWKDMTLSYSCICLLGDLLCSH